MPLFYVLTRVECIKEQELGSRLIIIIISYYLGLLRDHEEVVGGIHDSLKGSQSSDANDFEY